jgi:PAS domain S-box-containing protein
LDSQRKIKDLSRLKRRLAALLAALAVLVIGGAQLFYRQYSRHIGRTESDLIASIGKVKVQQLSDWREDRLARVRSLLDSPIFSIYLRRLAAAPGDKPNSALVRLRLESFARNNGFTGVALTGQEGLVLAAAGKRPWQNCPEMKRLIKDPALRRGPLLSEIHSDASGRSDIHILAQAEKKLFLVASLDLHDFLYPLIQTWPTSSPSAETLLVKSENGRILFLNELRHKKNTALRFTLPLDTAELPAVAAAKGETRIIKGLDYRGVPVLAYTAPVPGTNWGLVSKVDASEVFAELRIPYALLLLLVLAVLGAGVGAAFLLFRLQAAEYEKDYYDLTREAAARLRERDEVFGQFMEHSPVYIFFKDEQLRALHLSRNFEAWLGRPLSEMLGKSMAELFPPEVAKDMVADDKRVLAEGKEIAVEEELAGRRYRTIKFPLKLPGKQACLAGYTIDITEQERAKQELLERARELKEAQRLARLGNWTLDHATKDLRWSEEIFRIFELDPAQFGASYDFFLSAIHPEDREAVNAAYTDSLKNKTPYKIAHRLRMKDGRVKHVIECCETFFDAQGSPLLSVGTVQDVTELAETQQELDRKNNTMNSLLQSLTEGVFMVEAPSGKPIYANEAAGRLLGRGALPGVDKENLSEVYSALKVPGRAPYPPEEMPILRGMRGEPSHVDDMLVVRPDGTETLLEIYGTPVRDGSGRIWASLVSFSDITQRKSAEEKILRLNLDLREKNQELENFLYITTHDLRSPLVNIQGFSQNLRSYFAELCAMLPAAAGGERGKTLADKKIPEALGFLTEGARKMDALISALLKVSRLGRQELKPEKLDVRALLGRVLDAMRYQLTEAGAEVELAAGLPACLADSGAVTRVFSNLLDNALKYRSPDRELRVKVSGFAEGGRAVYLVADNAAGIAARDLGRLWDVFARPGAGQKGNGEGIGLPMVKKALERSGGSVSVESKEGQGSVFRVELPAA